MEWQQIEYFIAVANLQHMTKAAKELSVSQPALSRSIATLEKEIGTPLFERKGRNVFLNRYGRLFLERAKKAVEEIKNGQQEIFSLINPLTGVVLLSFPQLIGADLIPTILSEFREQYPNIQFELNQRLNDELMKELSNGEYDLAITTPELVTNEFSCYLLGEAELYLTVPSNHKWAKRTSISFKELQEEPYIGLKQTCGLSYTVNKLFEESQMTQNTVFKADELDTVAGLVSAGFGVSLLPKTKGLQNYQLSWLKVTEAFCRLSVGVVWKKERELTPVARVFLDFLRNRYPLMNR